MQEQTALDLFHLQQTRDDWENNVTGYCNTNNMQVGNLPKDVAGPYGEMNTALEKIKSGGEQATEETKEQFHKATAKLEKAWNNLKSG